MYQQEQERGDKESIYITTTILLQDWKDGLVFCMVFCRENLCIEESVLAILFVCYTVQRLFC